MEDLYLDKAISDDQIRSVLSGSFDTFLDKNKKEFGFMISIYRTPEEDSQKRALLIGKKISLDFNTRVLVPFDHPEDPNNPYYSIICDKGISYLANDVDMDEPNGVVKIIGEYFIY